MAWWWLLVVWPVAGVVTAPVVCAVIKRGLPDLGHELTPLPPGLVSVPRTRAVHRTPPSRPPAGRPDGAPPARPRPATTGTWGSSTSSRVPTPRSLRASRARGHWWRVLDRSSTSHPPSGTPTRPRRGLLRASGHAPVAGPRRRTAGLGALVPHRPVRSVRAAGSAPSPRSRAARIRAARTRGGPVRPAVRSRAPQRLLALTALSAIVLAPTLARSSSSLGFSDAIAAELAAHPDQVPATLEALNRGAAVSGLETPILVPDWETLPGTAPTESRSRTPERATHSWTGTTDQPRRTGLPVRPGTSSPQSVLPPAEPGDQPPAGDSPSAGVVQAPAPGPVEPSAPAPDPTVDPTAPADPTVPAPTPDPTEPPPTEPTDPAEPTEPTDPTDPVEPTEPTDPTDPSPEPTDPAPTTPAPSPTPSPAEPTPTPQPDPSQAPTEPTPTGPRAPTASADPGAADLPATSAAPRSRAAGF
ncbi:hypothetical protein JD78_03883 [Modestobacter roseus]|uniref:Uncharacterized protein n=1 Tax=Modestobacter roseus TaxID=1181884 RepID=A0A562IWI3_9ACTN|nr:hypothetical protein JD78_03883 [Modestobacter roseus]